MLHPSLVASAVTMANVSLVHQIFDYAIGGEKNIW